MSKPISIIIITNDESTILRQNLPELLIQQYDAPYEVIVVRETRRGDMKDLLEPFMAEYSHLRTTYLPDRPQYVSTEEIEILLGVKAAQHSDILIVPPQFVPYSDQWLQNVSETLDAEGLSPEKPLLLGNATISDLGFFKRRRHKKCVKTVLKRWAKTHDTKAKTFYMEKDTRELLTIAFLRENYIDDMPLRDVIYNQINI